MNLSAARVNANTVSLSWTASTDNVAVAGYTVLPNGTRSEPRPERVCRRHREPVHDLQLRSDVASSRGGLLTAVSRVPRACRAAPDPAGGMALGGLLSLDLGDRPAEADELAGAAAMIVRRLAPCSSRVQVRCGRCWAVQATATAWAGWPSWRPVNACRSPAACASARPPRSAGGGRGRSRSW